VTLRFTERMSRVGTEGAFEVLAQARRLEAQGRDIVHLEIGEPDFATPQNIVDAAVRAMRDGATHYTPASGMMEVREATARYVSRRTSVPVDAANVVLVPGSKNILHFALLSLVEEGDEVILPDPGYPIYRSLTEFVGARPVPIPIRESNDFRLDVDELRSLVTDRTRLLIVNTPANPTGGALTACASRPWLRSETWSCSATRSTLACCTTASTPRSTPFREWPRGQFSWTG
jgi:aspartate aminotransferase